MADSSLAAVIAAVPGLAERLLAEHLPGPDGRCARCTLGDQGGRQRWPCRIHDVAAAAAASRRPRPR